MPTLGRLQKPATCLLMLLRLTARSRGAAVTRRCLFALIDQALANRINGDTCSVVQAQFAHQV
jgi:hypothetical protein